MSRLTNQLGIELPIVQSGMGGVAGPQLAAAVSNAGALGVLAALRVRPDDLRGRIARMRERTTRPFGVNIWLHEEMLPPRAPADLDRDAVGRVQAVLNEMRADLDLPAAAGPPAPTPDLIVEALEVMVDERIPVFSAAVGLPSADLVGRFHDAGTVVMAMVTNVDDAVAAVDRGVDVLVVQGIEAGGHRSVGTKLPRAAAQGTGAIVLIPAVRDALGPEVPLVAAGGIADGRGVAAAMVLGADGVLLGTRFVATAESEAHDGWKRAILAGERPTVVTDVLTGQWARTLRNDFVDRYEESGADTLPSLLQSSAASDIYSAARRTGNVEMMPLYAGDSAQLIADLPAAADVVHEIAAEAARLLGRPLA